MAFLKVLPLDPWSHFVSAIGYSATLPPTTTGGTAPLMRICKLSENMQTYEKDEARRFSPYPYMYLSLGINVPLLL